MMSKYVRLVVLLGVLSVWLILPGLFQPAVSQNAGAIYIEEGEARAYLKLAHEYESAQRWRKAIEQYQLALRRYPDSVYQIDSNYYLGIRSYFHRQLLKYPDALATYREMFNATSEALYRKSLKEKNPEILQRIVNEMFLSTWGDNAADAWADMLVERGEIGNAIRLWDRILTTYPDSELSPATLLFKIALGAKYLGDEERYQQAVSRLRKNYLDEIIRLGVVEKKVSEGLEELDALPVISPTQVSEDWPCWGGNRSHTLTLNADSKNSIKLWEFKLSGSTSETPRPSFRVGGREVIRSHLQRHAPYCPIVSSNTVYINTGRVVLGLELETGKRIGAYPVGAKGAVPQANGVFSCHEANGIIYANLLRSPPRGQGHQAYLAAFEATTLKHKWNTLDLKDSLFDNIVLASPPLFCDDKVYAAVVKSTSGEAEVYVCCLDAASGTLLWKRFICFRASSSRSRRSYISGIMPTLAEANGIISCHTNQGVIAALSGQTGEILWLVNYEAEGRVSTVSTPISYPVIKNNLVCYALPGLNKVSAYNLLTGKKETGRLPWESTVNYNPYFIGVNGATLFVQGDDVRPINIISGKIDWSPRIDEREQIIGRGFVTRDHLYLATLSGLIRFDLKTRKVTDYPPLAWADDEDGGNILVVGNYLLSTSRTRLNVFQGLEAYTQAFYQKLQAQPKNVDLIKRFAQTMEANKQYALAIRVLTEHLNKITQTMPDGAVGEEIKSIRKYLATLYMKLGDALMQKEQLTQAIPAYQKALELISLSHPGGEESRILLKLGDCYSQTESFQKAVEAYQRVLQKQALGYYETKPSHRIKQTLYAELKIARIIKSQPEAYETIQQEAAQIYRSQHLGSGDNKDKLKAFVNTYPHAQLAQGAFLKLASLSTQANNPGESILYLRRLVRNLPPKARLALGGGNDSPAAQRGAAHTGEPPQRREVLTVIPRLIEVYEKAGAYHSLQHLLTWLVIKFPENQITIGQTRLKVKDYVSNKLSEIKIRLIPFSLPILRDSKLRYKFDNSFPTVLKKRRWVNPAGQQPIALFPARPKSNRICLQFGPDIEIWDIEKQRLLWVTPPDLWAGAVVDKVSQAPRGDLPVKAKRRAGPASMCGVEYMLDGNLIIGRHNLIYKFQADTGKTIWSYKAPGPINSWCAGTERFYLDCRQNKPNPEKPGKLPPYTNLLVCLDSRTGEVLWEQDGKESAVSPLILEGDELFLLRWFEHYLELNDARSGELIYRDKIQPLQPDSYTQARIGTLDKIYYFNPNNQLMAYDIYKRQQENLGVPASSKPDPWLGVSDKFVCMAFANKVLLFNRTKEKFFTIPETTMQIPLSKLPLGCYFKSIIDYESIYLWIDWVEEPSEKTRQPAKVPWVLFCIVSTEDKIDMKFDMKWRTTPFSKPNLDVVGITASQIVLKYSEGDKGLVEVRIIDKEKGKTIWTNSFKPHPLLSDVRINILGDKLVITAEEGVFIY